MKYFFDRFWVRFLCLLSSATAQNVSLSMVKSPGVWQTFGCHAISKNLDLHIWVANGWSSISCENNDGIRFGLWGKVLVWKAFRYMEEGKLAGRIRETESVE